MTAKRFLTLEDLSAADVRFVLDAARRERELRHRGGGGERVLDNHVVMQEAGGRLVGPAVAEGRWAMFDCGRYPAVLPAAEGGEVPDELYAIPPPGLGRLDELEDHPREYRRERVPVRPAASPR